MKNIFLSFLIFFIPFNAIASTSYILAPDWKEFWNIQKDLARFSCMMPKSCRAIAQCTEATWYYDHCEWGQELDSNHNGVPCENVCRKETRPAATPFRVR